MLYNTCFTFIIDQLACMSKKRQLLEEAAGAPSTVARQRKQNSFQRLEKILSDRLKILELKSLRTIRHGFIYENFFPKFMTEGNLFLLRSAQVSERVQRPPTGARRLLSEFAAVIKLESVAVTLCVSSLKDHT